MNRNNIGWGVLALAAAAAMSGCGKKNEAVVDGAGSPGLAPQKLSSGILPAGQEAGYLPIAVGNQWTYDAETIQAVNGRQGAPVKSTITYLIKKVTDGPNGRKFVQFEIKEGDKPLESEIWFVDSKGIAQYALGAKLNKLSSPQYLVDFPVKVGADHKWVGNILDDKQEVRNTSMTWTVSGEEQIDMATQSYNALAIVGIGKMSSGSKGLKAGLGDRIWFVPKMGIVRRRQEMAAEVTSTDPKTKGAKAQVALARTLRLRNFTPKK
jgi:hypothetical protein